MNDARIAHRRKRAWVNWSSGRSHRKDYKFRDYSAIFAD
jgi:hypothetical protein